MSEEMKITVIVGEKIAQKVTAQEAYELIKGIKQLRKESPLTIPPIHITDETRTGTDYEIRIENKTVLAKNTIENTNYADLVKMIRYDINEVCKRYA